MTRLKHIFKFIILISILSCNGSGLIKYTNENQDEFLSNYLKRNSNIKSFEGHAEVTLNYHEAGKLESQKFDAVIQWNENDSMSIEMKYGLMGINLADVAKLFVGKNNYVFVTRENLFLTGLSDDNYLNQLFRIEVPLKKWAPILFMNILFEEDTSYQKQITEHTLTLENEHEKIVFRKDIGLPGKVIFTSSNQNQIEITFEYTIIGDSYPFPQRIVYYDHMMKSEVIIEYNSINVNKPLPKKGFEVKIPSQMEQIIYE